MTISDLPLRIYREIDLAPPGLFDPPRNHWREIDPDGVLDAIWLRFLNDRFNGLHPLVFADRLDELRDDSGELARLARYIRLDSQVMPLCESRQGASTCDCETCSLRREKAMLWDGIGYEIKSLTSPYYMANRPAMSYYTANNLQYGFHRRISFKSGSAMYMILHFGSSAFSQYPLTGCDFEIPSNVLFGIQRIARETTFHLNFDVSEGRKHLDLNVVKPDQQTRYGARKTSFRVYLDCTTLAGIAYPKIVYAATSIIYHDALLAGPS